MIVNQADGWLIATPPRCGTHTLESLARTHGWEIVRPGRHRMTVPPQHQKLTRRMMVRDPYDHLQSVWRYLRRRNPGADWGWRAAVALDFPEFLHFLAAHKKLDRQPDPSRAPDMWTVSFTDCLNLLSADGHPVEPLQLDHLADWLGLPTIPHNDRSKTPPPVWTPGAIRTADRFWCAADCARFGYPRRPVN